MASTVATARPTFQVRSPVDGAVLATLTVEGPDEVRAAVERAREAQRDWGALSPRARAFRMRALTRVMERRADHIARTIVSETGKPAGEALPEVVVSLDLVRYYRRVAPRALRRRRVSPGWMLWKRAYVEREPYGVVGAITPWNYPLILVMDTVAASVFAGNAVVIKPSEFTPLTALLVPELCREAGLPEGLVSVVTGRGETGEALVRAGVDRVSFTGSSATGRRVMQVAAESLTPLTLELGGKDPALVLEDADLERAAQGVVFGAFFNAGQTCLSIERAYVARPIFEAFSARVADVARGLRVGTGVDADVGPLITEQQFETVSRHVEDALARGARALCGGAPIDRARRLYPPTVLVDVDDSMAVLHEETFGPVLPLVPVDGPEDALARANASPYGLFASVWTGDVRTGEALARRLRAGGVSINDALAHYAVPGLPMGGVGESGFGRRRGEEGLLESTRARTVFLDRAGLPREPWWFPYGASGLRFTRAALAWSAHGGLLGLVRAARRMVEKS